MSQQVFREKSFAFAVLIVECCKSLYEQKEFVLSKQLLRSGTAVGAIHREAENAESTKDFIHKMAIAQKECNETIYWLELLYATSYLSESNFKDLHFKGTELLKLSTAIIKTAKSKLNTNH